MKILIVDDETPARRRLARLLEEHEVMEAANGRDAIDIAAEAHPDIALLDVRMPGMDGLELAAHLNALPASPSIIFVTAFDTHALEAFNAHAMGYLLKPVEPTRLTAALQRAQHLHRGQSEALREMHPRPRRHLGIADTTGIQLIPVDEIRAFRAAQKYTTVLRPGSQLLSTEPLRALEQEFAASFVRIHRNALVATAHITALQADDDHGLCVHLDGLETPLPVSRRCLPALRRRIKLVDSGA